MNPLEIMAWVGLAAAVIPLGLLLCNLAVYKRLPASKPGTGQTPVSVLIPARNEELNIAECLKSVLANRNCEFEVVVLDDHSSDKTREIVEAMAKMDGRVRLETASPLPEGWCGKQHACYTLAGMARNPLLVFVDADVRLAPDALTRISSFMAASGAALASGVPSQRLGTFSEKLLLPFIQHILLCYLPMPAARLSRSPSFAAGCGQLMITTAEAYRKAGGHAKIRTSLHDGLKLPRAFREAGFRTELFDATDLAWCRMYSTNGQVWSGLSKNAVEGMAAPGTILPMTVLLAGAGILPLITLALSDWESRSFVISCFAVVIGLIPRLAACAKFGYPVWSALANPIGIAALLSIQWRALIRYLQGRPENWKGRNYESQPADHPVRAAGQGLKALIRSAAVLLLIGGILLGLTAAMGAETVQRREGATLSAFEMQDQFGTRHSCSWTSNSLTILVIADREGVPAISPAVSSIRKKYPADTQIIGVANVSGVPSAFRPMVRGKIKKHFTRPVLLDWDGELGRKLDLKPGVPNLIVVNDQGKVMRQAVFSPR